MSNFQRSFSREDPRLSRHQSTSPKESRKSPAQPSKTAASWDNRNQFSSQLQTNYQHLQPNNVYSISPYGNTAYYGYESYSYNPYQYNQAGQAPYVQGGVAPPSEDYPQGSWSAAYPSQNTSTEFAQNESSTTTVSNKKSEGVAEELSKQKEGLLKEREIYEDRVRALKEKLKLLVDQKEQLSSKRSPDRETLHIIKENTKLQVEIQSKITDANNVIEILTNLIGDKKKEKNKESSKSSAQEESKVEQVNYKHYDPEIHWCRMCDVFPQSAKELLQHLHSKQHQKLSQEENPWHKLPPEPKYPEYEGAPSRRLPIKGLQFFVAATAWYCRLCDSWIGDLHCASQHLMSVTHSQNFANFVEQNPHWEIEWLKDREKALERVKRTKSDSDSDEKKKKHKKDKHSPQSQYSKDKKKKKQMKKRKRQSSDSSSSSSSSSSSEDERDDKSKSIRVLMRNKIKMLTEGEEKWELINKIVEEERKRKELKQKDKEAPSPPEDKLMSQWMTVSAPPDKDKQMLEGLKEKLKQKQDAEKAKAAAEAASKKQREKEEYERKVKERERQALLEREEEMRRKEQEKMSVKMKAEVKIKGKDNYRKRRSHSRSRSPDHYRKRSRSRSSDRRPSKNGRSDGSPKRHRDDDKSDKKSSSSNKRLPFIGRMPLFKNQKGSKKPEEERKTKEIQKEDYDVPRKTRFQPGNLAKAFIPKPDVVCYPKLSSYPPLAPPPPAILEPPPEPPKISSPKPPPAPTIEENQEESSDEEPEDPGKKKTVVNNGQPDYNMMYDESMYYGNMDFNMMYQPPPENFAFMQVPNSNDTPVPPLQPPPLPPDDPNDDLALLGLSSDDMAVQHL